MIAHDRTRLIGRLPFFYLFGRNQRLISVVFVQKITISGKSSVKASSALLR